jgi:zinc protease
MQMSRAVLNNGAVTIVGVDRALPIAAIVVVFRGGVRVETEDTQGLSNLTAQMLTKGTAKRSALEIAQHVESLGGTLEPFSGRDGFGLALQLLAPDLNEGLLVVELHVVDPLRPEEIA